MAVKWIAILGAVISMMMGSTCEQQIFGILLTATTTTIVMATETGKKKSRIYDFTLTIRNCVCVLRKQNITIE